MSNVNVDSQIIKEAMNICNKAIDMLRATQKQMQNKYREAGENWNDSKYQQLGDIVDECDSSINKTLRELEVCLMPLSAIEASIQEYESVNFFGVLGSAYDGTGATATTTEGVSTNNDEGLNSQPYSALRPASLAGALRGGIMTRYEANHEKPNPNYKIGGGYEINCQTCVVAYEARLRGYDVSALPNTAGSRLEELSRQTNRAWIDPQTNDHPEYIVDYSATSPEKYRSFLEDTIRQNERYTLEFVWKKRRLALNRSNRNWRGHIISLDRDESGNLRLYDPQISRTYTGSNLDGYLRRFVYSDTANGVLLPRVLRVDNQYFNTDLVDSILEARR